jgi:hypothetical protein
MTAGLFFRYVALWSVIGALAFSLYVVFAFRSGLVYTARKADGTLKDRVPAAGVASMAGFLLLLIGFLVLANRIGLGEHITGVGFGQLFLLNLALYLVLFVFDTLIIDTLVLGVWRPAFLRVPNEMGASSMSEHARRSLPVSLAAGIILALVSAAVSYLVWAHT